MWKRKIKQHWKRVCTKCGEYSRLEQILLFAGIVGLSILLTALFTGLSDTNVDPSVTSTSTASSPQFLREVESVSGSVFEKSPEPVILNNGDEFVPDLLREIAQASSSVSISNFIWKKGNMTDQILDALTEKARQGVSIRLLMDGIGSASFGGDKLDALKKAGGKVAVFRPVEIGKLTRLVRRAHARLIVIDGRVGYTGGIAFDDTWLGNGTGEKTWRDMMVKVKGAAASRIQDTFALLWSETTGEIMGGPSVYPTLSSNSAHTNIISILHSPTPDVNKKLAHLLWLSIMGATNHIEIENPYLLPDQSILQALEYQASHGIRVDMVVPGPYIDQKHVRLASETYYPDLLAAGVHIYEYQPGRIHLKAMSVDGVWSIVGSPNLDNRSSELNIEYMLGIDDKVFAATFEKQFKEDLNASKEVRAASYSRFSLSYALGLVSRLFVKQY